MPALAMDDLAIIVVSTNEAKWLHRCLPTVFEHVGSISVDVVVADNESTDGTRDLVERSFPAARIVSCANRGFAHANNRAFLTTDARYILFLNPDTEIVEGTFEGLVGALDERPSVGLAGVRQLESDGSLSPTIRRFPNAVRALGEALGSERLPFRGTWLGERELRMELYSGEQPCDWTTGSFMLARREALDSAGCMDERLFMYSDEPDLCRRMRQAGWEIRHLPLMTIIHHAGKAGISERISAQHAFARMQYAKKHFAVPHRATYASALALGYVLRMLISPDPSTARQRRAANRRALRTLLGRDEPPFGPPPAQALSPDARATARSGRSPSPTTPYPDA